ncbi:MAG TPA: PAS domain S-box protein, partial [Planctomycetota bacterium]|nr:PAS domain S-box protein [Planctomycetota bacterium]
MTGDGRRSAGATALDLSDDAVYALDLAGLIVSWNPGAERVFGYAPEEILGAPSSLLAPAERASEEAGLLSLARVGEATRGLETVRRRKDGRRVDVA